MVIYTSSVWLCKRTLPFKIDHCNNFFVITSTLLLCVNLINFLVKVSKLVQGLLSRIHNLNMYKSLVLRL